MPPRDARNPAPLVKLSRRLERERATRFEAERIAERGLRELYDRQQQLLLLEQVAVAANESTSLPDTLQLSLSLVCEFTGWVVGHAYLRDETSSPAKMVSARIWHGAGGAEMQAFRQFCEHVHFDAGAGLPGCVLASGKAEWISDLSLAANFPRSETTLAAGLRAACAFPVKIGNEVVAAVEFFHDAIAVPSEMLLQLMAQIGAQIGRVIERKRAEDHRLAAREARFALDRRRLIEKSEEQLRHRNLLLDAALHNMSQGLLMFDVRRRLVLCNQRFAEMYGLAPEDVLPGTALQSIMDKCRLNGVGSQEAIETFSGWLATAREASSNLYDLLDGRKVILSCQPMPDGGWVTTHEDVTERQNIQTRIAHMAHHDALTDLANRVLFRERLERALAKVTKSAGLAVLCLDLDRFKFINDTLGHPTGDLVLKIVADRLRDCVRGGDTVARLGGDEFAIIMRPPVRPQQAAALATRIRDALTAPCDTGTQQVKIDVSIGVAMASAGSADPDQLLSNADIALYRAKSGGRGGYRFFEPAMDAEVRARRELEQDLREAIAGGQFELFYQPIVDLAENRIASCEALVRWRHPRRGLVPPAEFIAVAEELGLMIPLGEWVIRRACADAASWSDEVGVAVNVSPAQVAGHGLVQTVVNAMAASGLPASRLEIEITESVLIHDNEGTLATLHLLRGLGVGIAMDDFGTGYSSLSYLRSFPFDKIKIDRSFIQGLPDDRDSLAIVKAVMNLAKNLDMRTTAEGVESEAQLAEIRSLGCNEMQGYLFSRPVPAGEFRRMLPTERKTAAA